MVGEATGVRSQEATICGELHVVLSQVGDRLPAVMPCELARQESRGCGLWFGDFEVGMLSDDRRKQDG